MNIRRRLTVVVISLAAMTILIALPITLFGPNYFGTEIYRRIYVAVVVIGGVIAISSSLIQGADSWLSILDRVAPMKSCTVSNESLAREVLAQLKAVEGQGVDLDNLFMFVMRIEQSLSNDEIENLCAELEQCGYIKREENLMRITHEGEEYLHMISPN